MPRIDAPVSLRHAREEILLALGASSAEDEAEHRKLAGAYIIEAVHDIQREPDRKRDWALIAPVGVA